MPLYSNNGELGYQATIHGEQPEEYLMIRYEEATEEVINHSFEQSTEGETLRELCIGELEP